MEYYSLKSAGGVHNVTGYVVTVSLECKPRVKKTTNADKAYFTVLQDGKDDSVGTT